MERIAINKRKASLSNLQRRVRARKYEPEEILSDASQGKGSSEEEEGSEEESEKHEEEQDDEEAGSSSEDNDDEVENPSAVASQISFGALAKAQASLPSARRGKARMSQEEDEDEEDSDSDQPDSKPKDKSRPKPHRSSKHAPAEQSSKRPVSRKREVVSIHKPVARDPRFSAAVSGRPIDEDKLRKAYSFLDEYRDSEMAELRAAIKKTKDAGAKEELKRALASMESKKQAQKQRDKERELLEEHRRQEKELVKQGKKPFYLKKSEQKKQLLVDRFSGLKKKQVDRVIERRRKKLAARERRDMPMPAPRREAR
ncbi:hypothetical protein M434DRAFT_396297 [Hypoxylon sp. CO27-5]|nr:hypothetical protein M434DRAFT_396297 [Hypoxylon sp. CO27-5]